MKAIPVPPVAMLALGAGAAILAWGAWRTSKNGGTLAQNIGTGAVEAVADTGAGVVLGVGDVLGIPRTNETECERAIREGRTWDASFACPAWKFITEGIFGSNEVPNTSGGASGSW